MLSDVERQRRGIEDTSARTLRAVMLERQVLDLRIGGATIAQISTQLSITISTAHRSLVRAIKRNRKRFELEIDEKRKLEEERLDSLWMEAYVLAQTQRGLQKLPAIRECVRISKARRELLGLNAPLEIELNGKLDLSSLFKGNTIDADYQWLEERAKNGPPQFGNVPREFLESVGQGDYEVPPAEKTPEPESQEKIA